MYLRDLQINLSDAATLPANFAWRDIGTTLHTVVESYLEELPRRKVQLGGAAKINVQLGPRPTQGTFSHSDFGIYPDGVGWIWLQSFDFIALAAADVQGQHLLLLNALHEGLLEVARRTGSDTQPFLKAKNALLTARKPDEHTKVDG